MPIETLVFNALLVNFQLLVKLVKIVRLEQFPLCLELSNVHLAHVVIHRLVVLKLVLYVLQVSSRMEDQLANNAHKTAIQPILAHANV